MSMRIRTHAVGRTIAGVDEHCPRRGFLVLSRAGGRPDRRTKEAGPSGGRSLQYNHMMVRGNVDKGSASIFHLFNCNISRMRVNRCK